MVWGKTKKEYTAVMECYPVEEEKESQASQDDLQPRTELKLKENW